MIKAEQPSQCAGTPISSGATVSQPHTEQVARIVQCIWPSLKTWLALASIKRKVTTKDALRAGPRSQNDPAGASNQGQ